MNAPLSQKTSAAAKAQWARPAQPKIVLTLPFPPSVNHLWRHGGKGKGYYSERYTLWIRVAGMDLNLQKPGCIDGAYRLNILLGRPDGIARDADNYLKAVSDLLVEHHVVEDDAKAVSVSAAWSTSSRFRGCRVTLTQAKGRGR